MASTGEPSSGETCTSAQDNRRQAKHPPTTKRRGPLPDPCHLIILLTIRSRNYSERSGTKAPNACYPLVHLGLFARRLGRLQRLVSLGLGGVTLDGGDADAEGAGGLGLGHT